MPHLDTIARFKKRFRTTPKARPVRSDIEKAARLFADWLAANPPMDAAQEEAATRICLDFTAIIKNDHPVFRRGLADGMARLQKARAQ